MKLRLLFGIGAVCLAAVCASAQDIRIASVDLDRAFSEFYKTKLADAQLKQQAEEFKTERKKLVDAFKQLQESFDTLREEAQNTALNEDARAQKKAEAEEKLVEIRDQESKIRRFDESRQKQLDEQSRRMETRLVDEIQDAVKTLARKENLSLVLDTSAKSRNGIPVVAYTDGKRDITNLLIEELNKGKTSLDALPPELKASTPAAPAAAPTTP